MWLIGLVFWCRYVLHCLWRSVLECMKPSTDSVVAGLLTDVVRSNTELMAQTPF